MHDKSIQNLVRYDTDSEKGFEEPARRYPNLKKEKNANPERMPPLNRKTCRGGSKKNLPDVCETQDKEQVSEIEAHHPSPSDGESQYTMFDTAALCDGLTEWSNISMEITISEYLPSDTDDASSAIRFSQKRKRQSAV